MAEQFDELRTQLTELTRRMFALESKGERAALLEHIANDGQFRFTNGRGQELQRDELEPKKGDRSIDKSTMNVRAAATVGVVSCVIEVEKKRYRNTLVFERPDAALDWKCVSWHVTALKGDALPPLPSTELRWFGQGHARGDVLAWFSAMQPEVVVPPRTDTYMIIDGIDALGIKLREGKIEVKKRVGEARHNFLGRSGRVSQWLKWSLLVANQDARTGTTTSNTTAGVQWIDVEKVRRWVKFRIDPAGNVGEPSHGRIEGTGCAVELTDLQVAGEKWWTLGFESFSDEGGDLTKSLVSVATQVLRSVPGPIGAEMQADYPEWLRKLRS